jgi:hypothetical protein
MILICQEQLNMFPESIKTILELHIVFMNFKYIDFPSDTIFLFLVFIYYSKFGTTCFGLYDHHQVLVYTYGT